MSFMFNIPVVLVVVGAVRKDTNAHRMADYVHIEDILEVAEPLNKLRMTKAKTNTYSSGCKAFRKCSQYQKV